MRELTELQNEFQQYVLKKHLYIHNEIVNTPQVPATTRLEIYRDAYYLRLLESLSTDYPVLYAALGEKKFSAVGSQYIDTHTSSFRSIRGFGAHFNTAFPASSFHHELALFEWLLTETFDASDHTTATIETMATLSPELWPEITFQLHPTLRRAAFSWNTVIFWKAFYEGRALPKPKQQKTAIPWVLWRKGLETQFCTFSNEEIFMLNAMHKGAPFGELCEGLADFIKNPAEIPTFAAIHLKKFLDAGLIAHISVANQD